MKLYAILYRRIGTKRWRIWPGFENAYLQRKAAELDLVDAPDAIKFQSGGVYRHEVKVGVFEEAK